MTKPRVLISDKMDPKAEQIFRERGCDVDVITGKTPEELKAIIGQYDGLAIRSTTRLTSELIDAATNLKVVGRAGIGVDNIDIPAASRKGIVVMNTPFGNSITTAEHAIALIFALARTGRAGMSAAAVGAYIGAAYWFTSSTSFANPAVSLGRMFSDTFAGIAPSSVPMFLAMQIVGAALALALIWLLYPTPAQRPLLAAALEAP
jgi:lactate dehydrogenase-like 2-hydroxyacid dehydrogenase